MRFGPLAEQQCCLGDQTRIKIYYFRSISNLVRVFGYALTLGVYDFTDRDMREAQVDHDRANVCRVDELHCS